MASTIDVEQTLLNRLGAAASCGDAELKLNREEIIELLSWRERLRELALWKFLNQSKIPIASVPLSERKGELAQRYDDRLRELKASQSGPTRRRPNYDPRVEAVREIARSEGATVQTVHRYLEDARSQIRRQLERCEREGPPGRWEIPECSRLLDSLARLPHRGAL